MAGPITWRNIPTSGMGGGASLLAQGQNQMQQGLQTLQNLFTTNAKEDAANREAIKSYNTQQFLDQVAAADPAVLATPEGQAALNQQRAQFGTMIDQAGTRNAVANQLGNVQKQQMAQGQFDDFTTERGQRALVDNLRGLAAAGDQAGVEQILNDNAFLQEGELRKELSGVFDSAKQRQYRESAEGRAQRGEDRSAASHALSMESGRENLGFAKASHANAINKMREDSAADSIALQAWDTTKNANQAQSALVADIAAANELTLSPDGSIDLSKASKEVQDTVAKQLQESGAGNNTATAARQRVVEMSRQAGLGTAATEAALKRFDTVQAFDNLAPEDQAKVATDVNTATVDLRAAEKQLTESYNRKMKDNPFVAPSNDVTADSNRIVEAASKKHDSEWFNTDINKRNLGEEAIDMMQNGISFKLDGEDFEGVVPPSIIERAMLETGANKFFAEGGTVRKLVEDYIKENKGLQRQIKDSQTLTEQFQKDIGKINGEKVKIENSITRARKKEKGVTVSNNDWIDAVIRRRNASGN